MGYKGNFPQIMREAGFKLRQYRDGPLDWRLMGSYETDRILREQNIEIVDEALQHLSEAPLGTVLETHILDSGIAKYFIMSQYAIQYLLYCRMYLDESVGELKEAHATAQQEIAKLRQSLSESNNEVVQLHKKITQIETIREVVFPCHLCTKNFISNDALNIHIGRKHRVGTPTTNLAGGSVAKDKDNDMQLINTIKMELEIKQLKERLNAAERNIKERSGSSRRHASPRQDQATATTNVRNVGIQSNLAEYKEKDEISSEAIDSEASERKEQLHGLAERLNSFEVWQAQLKQSNEQFIQNINQKLEDLNCALELSKQSGQIKVTTATPTSAKERVATPCLEDLERILAEKVAEIGKVSANKLEEVVYHLEMGYKDKLETLERELKRLTEHKEAAVVIHSASKIPKPLPKNEVTDMERIKRQVENEFLKTKADDDTYSIEEIPAQPEKHQMDELPTPKQTVTQVQELPSRSNAGSLPTYTKPAAEPEPKPNPKPSVSQSVIQEATDISESLSEEETVSNEGSELLTSEPERQVFMVAKIKEPPKSKSPQKPKQPLTRKDARKLVNLKLNPHGFNMKSKSISSASFKRVSDELVKHRNTFRLDNPHFYATRNRIRKFIEKLCSAKMPESAQVLLKTKTPLHPIDALSRRGTLSGTTTDDDDDEVQAAEQTSVSQDDEVSQSSSAPQQRHSHRAFKEQLEQMLAKPAAARRAISRPGTTQAQLHQARPVPLPRKRVMFNTLSSGEEQKN